MAPKRSPLHTPLNAVTGIDHGGGPETPASTTSGSTASAASGPAGGAGPGVMSGAAPEAPAATPDAASPEVATVASPEAATPEVASPARVSLDSALGRAGAVDGGWWPRSRDAAAELPGLIADIDHRLNRPVLRVGLPLESWDDIPHRVAAPGRQVKVGWFRHMDAHTVTLIGANMEAVVLRVVPPDTEDGAAADALTAAASGA